MKNNKNSKYYVPANIQKLFVGTIGSIYVIQFLFVAKMGIEQYQQNPDMGGFGSTVFTTMLVPIVLFVVAYSLNPRSLNLLARSFETMLITLAGLTVWSLLSMLIPFVFLRGGSTFTGSYAQYELILNSIFIIAYGFFLNWLRVSKRWQ